MFSRQDLSGLKILVTAGATIEPIDPVRFITNRSSGKMGYAIAGAATGRGAQVVLVSGPSVQREPTGVLVEKVRTTEEMKEAVFKHHKECDIIIKAAAVSDYRPRENAKQKIKKRDGVLSLDLVQNPDILMELGCAEERDRFFLVGFAAETENLLAHAKEKLKKKNLDMIVANDVSREDAGFESDTNLVKIITRDGGLEELPLMTKQEVAHQLLDRIISLRKGAG
jgi:phosphopantothenoylcysteine decarboxylase/phosphopantothenate--cysteine ligase